MRRSGGAMEQPYATHGVQVVGAKLGNMAGLYGAAYLALQTG